MVPSCSSVLPVLASAAMLMLAPCCYAQVLAASPAEPHNSLALLQQHVHMAREPEAGGDDLAAQGSPCNTTDCDAAGVVQKQEHNESVVDNNASQASVLPHDDQSPESQQHDSTEEAETGSNQSGASHVPASEQVLEATGQSNRDQEMFDQDVEEQMDSAGDKSSVWEDKVNVWENLVTDAEIQANETGKEQVCVSLPVFENVEWVDELIKNFLHFTWPGTKLAIHLNALTEYSEEDITRWNQTSSRIVVNPERIRVHKFMGGLLYTYVMNAKFLESVFPGQCGYFVMQESNQMWLRVSPRIDLAGYGMSSEAKSGYTSPDAPAAASKANGKELVKRNKVMVRVPATSANLGPGFDAVGMAVDIWNEFTVERSDKFEITTEGEGAASIPVTITEDGKSNHLVIMALKRAFEYAGETPMPPVRVKTRNVVPICSGFGSSSSAIVGGLIAGLVLAGKELKVREDAPGVGSAATVMQGLDPEELLHLATDIEGHPDNVAPAIYGGIQLSVQTHPDVDHGVPKAVMSRRIPYPNGLRLVAYVPTESARLGSGLDKTEEMRNLLKPTIDRKDAVFNIQRTALLIDALHRGDFNSLRFAVRDRLHQPIRGEKKYPHFDAVVKAALEAGAHGAFLSGAGPTVMAICSGQAGDIFTQRSSERQEGVVAEAMQKALDALPADLSATWGGGTFYIVSPTEKGAHVVLTEPKFSGGLATFTSLDGQL